MGLIIIIAIIVFLWYQFKVKPSRNEGNPANEFDKAVINSEQIISHNVKKLKKFTEMKISLSYLTGCNWILQNEASNIMYTFRSNGELLITTNGIVQKFSYELIIDNNTILLTKNEVMELYNIVNVQNDFLYLNRVSSNEVLMFLNQTKIKDEVKQIISTNYYNNLNQQKENDFIKNDYDVQSLGFSMQQIWEKENPNKNHLDYIAFLQDKKECDFLLYKEWLQDNPEGNYHNYITYLQYHKYMK